MSKIQIIVKSDTVIIDDRSINFDCSRFDKDFVFCEINENEKWIEKEPFNGREDFNNWQEIEDFILEIKLNQEKTPEIQELKQYLKETDFYYLRKMETGEDIPIDIVEKRLNTRLRIRELEDN
ncbi:hypothetical protein [Arcobacter aquimarinus]|uniref:hypothetical protein n=1 Tax=Arcobacter aquimarinus TaxID=1315211 RepID=UPI003BB02615